MINDKLIDVFLQNAEQEDLIRGIKEIINHFKIDSEYRVIVLNNKIELIYEKIRPIIYGDGVSKISTLLKEFNPSYNYLIKKHRKTVCFSVFCILIGLFFAVCLLRRANKLLNLIIC